MTSVPHCTDREQITKARQSDNIAPLKTWKLETRIVEKAKATREGKRDTRKRGNKKRTESKQRETI